jgi:hypothetical protein
MCNQTDAEPGPPLKQSETPAGILTVEQKATKTFRLDLAVAALRWQRPGGSRIVERPPPTEIWW